MRVGPPFRGLFLRSVVLPSPSAADLNANIERGRSGGHLSR